MIAGVVHVALTTAEVLMLASSIELLAHASQLERRNADCLALEARADNLRAMVGQPPQCSGIVSLQK
jgi:hypothetical protein